MAADVPADGRALRRPVRRRVPTDRAGAAPSGASGPIRGAGGAPRHDAGPRCGEPKPAKALWAGIAAHAFHRLDRPMTSAVGLMLFVVGHAEGWVVAKGGSQTIADALVADIRRHGGRIETGVRVTAAADLAPSDLLLLDVSPSVAADILGDRLPVRVARCVPPVPSRTGCIQGRLCRAGRGAVDGAGSPARRARCISVEARPK